MKSKTFDELAKEAVDNALKNIEISGVHFRQFVEKFGNAHENTKCNLSNCRHGWELHGAHQAVHSTDTDVNAIVTT